MMLTKWIKLGSTVVGAARAVLGSGVIFLTGPRTAVKIVRDVARFGLTPATLLALGAAKNPQRTVLKDERGSVSYAQMQAETQAISAGLYATLQNQSPRCVGVICRNHRGFLQSFIAAVQLGSEVVLINTELPHLQLERILARHDFDVLIVDSEYVSSLSSIAFPGLVIVADADHHDTHLTLGDLARTPGIRTPAHRRASRITVLTSGTTGVAKGVPRAVKPLHILGIALSGLHVLRLRAGDVFLIAPPFFHGFGLIALITSLAVRGTVVCAKKFDPHTVVKAFDSHKVTVFVGVPVMFQRVIAAVGSDERRNGPRLALTGAAPMSATVARDFSRIFGQIIVNGYGSTEIGIVSLASPRDIAAAPGTVGRAILGVEIRVLDHDRRSVSPGQVGEIFIRGSLTTTSYTQDLQNTPHPKEKVGDFVTTGDMGHLDSEGRLFIEGRADDMIVSGGENIFPREVEEVLFTHSGVLDVAVKGIVSEEFGQVLRAYIVVVPAQGALTEPPTVEELKNHVKSLLEPYKVPKEFVFLPEIPRNPSGKVTVHSIS